MSSTTQQEQQYPVLQDSEQRFASEYRTVLPTEEELTAELEREMALIID
ncbi:MAG: hypothetical protein P1U89_26770 [Verrucomicrobiales bacterium]|nr:hypothetical protein [Verrucomicrobiales bacterium]